MNVIFLITQEDPHQTDVCSDNTTSILRLHPTFIVYDDVTLIWNESKRFLE